MKKVIALVLSVITLFAFISCKKEKSNDTYNLAVVDGAPLLSAMNVSDGFAYETDNNVYNTQMQIVPSGNDVVSTLIAGLSNGTYDMSIMPVNAAAKIHATDEKYKLAAVNVFGNIYIVGKETINNDLNNLKGKVVYLTSGGGTPQSAFLRLLKGKNIEAMQGDTAVGGKVVYRTSMPAEIMQGLKNGNVEYAVLAEPVVTKFTGATGASVVFDIQSEWKNLNDNAVFTQAGLLVNSENVNIDYVKALVEKLKENKEYLQNNVENLKTSITTLYKDTTMGLNFSNAVIDRCNIGCETASSLKTDIALFLTAHGMTAPADSFYLF